MQSQNKYYRPTWAEIDLGALEFNLRQIRKIVGRKTNIMPVIKCDAYGHGMIPVARRLVSSGIHCLGVASIDEAIILRKHAIRSPILVLSNILKRDINAIINYKLQQTVSDYQLAFQLNKSAGRRNKRIQIHIKIDTGMGRLGVLHEEALKLILKVNRLPHLKIIGLYTHFPCADTDAELTAYQIAIFKQLVEDLKKHAIEIPFIHSANSMGLIGYSDSHFNLVHPGLVIYGIYPNQNINSAFKPVLCLKTQIIYIKRIPAGRGISYGHSFITKESTQIAVLSIGYGDGYPRNLSNRSEVIIRKKRYRISGTICMDHIMVDIGNSRFKIGDEAILIGGVGNRNIAVEELALLSGTIPYEIVCRIGNRVPRVYKD